MLWAGDESRVILTSLRSKGQLAKQDSGKSLAAQLVEILALRCGPGKLDADEYYQYRLYDDTRFTWRGKKAFFGKLMEQRLVPVLEATRWPGLVNDKLAMYAFFDGTGLPTPRITTHGSWRTFLFSTPGRHSRIT